MLLNKYFYIIQQLIKYCNSPNECSVIHTANRISHKILFHVGRDKFRIKSFADSMIVNDASRHIHTTTTWHRVRKIARVCHKASYSLPAKFVSGPLCRVRRCVCTHQVHPDDTCFVSHIKHSRGRNIFWKYRYRFILLLDVTLGFVRFCAVPPLSSSYTSAFLQADRFLLWIQSTVIWRFYMDTKCSIEIDCEIGEHCLTPIFAINSTMIITHDCFSNAHIFIELLEIKRTFCWY